MGQTLLGVGSDARLGNLGPLEHALGELRDCAVPAPAWV